MDPDPSRPDSMTPLLQYTLYQEKEDRKTLHGHWHGAQKKMTHIIIDKVKSWNKIIQEYDEVEAKKAGPSDNGGQNITSLCVPIVIFEHMATRRTYPKSNAAVDRDILDTENELAEYVLTKLWQERKTRYMHAKHSNPFDTDQDFPAFINTGLADDVRSFDPDIRLARLMDQPREQEIQRLKDIAQIWCDGQRVSLTAPIFNMYHATNKQHEEKRMRLTEQSLEFEFQRISLDDSEAGASSRDTEMLGTTGFNTDPRVVARLSGPRGATFPPPGHSSVDRRHFGSC
ncbi:hypothetical protein UCRPA7_2906 [Phaeoacremonium minimum UCRPA7]|uniref:Uncharacterized protein n=1 Tax=Phaeoacremonium minimum (strain UCR-PA7) TaxID=1286976 RepID=R8BQH3_PHAM7|nr:hypothetical protein UCRPA7_2906 [Phaeoacremonium minimum UCRPA7]EOO01606.1 hypothetical protein UCRPA7_2906 [Phaeoacremonium minimum UCRPA7]